MATIRPSEIAFVNSVSGPISTYKETHLYAIYNHLYERGHSQGSISNALYTWNKYFDDISSGAISESTLLFIEDLIKNEPNVRYRPRNSSELPDRPLPEDINFSVEGDLSNIICAVLLQYGKYDIIVDTRKSLTLIPTTSNFEIKNYKDTDHSMNFDNGDANPLFIEDKLIWIKSVLGAK